MVALTIIGDPFPDWEASLHEAAARDLTRAVAATAPRSCSAHYVMAKDSTDPSFNSPLIRTIQVPTPKKLLPILWQTGAAARPLDGEFIHSMTPLTPLRSHADERGSQASVLVPHDISWTQPELLPTSQARLFRRLVRRAAKLADVILTPTHAAAKEFNAQYSARVPVQVLPLASPSVLREPEDADERRKALGLPDAYVVTSAADNEFGRLNWVSNALHANPSLPKAVVIEGLDPEPAGREPQDAETDDRVVRVRPRDLADVGAIISGAEMMLSPQSYADTGYTVLAALEASVPVLHSGQATLEELVLDAGAAADDAERFAAELDRIFDTDGELARLRVLALDRSRSFSWRNTAWQLWETHANL